MGSCLDNDDSCRALPVCIGKTSFALRIFFISFAFLASGFIYLIERLYSCNDIDLTTTYSNLVKCCYCNYEYRRICNRCRPHFSRHDWHHPMVVRWHQSRAIASSLDYLVLTLLYVAQRTSGQCRRVRSPAQWWIVCSTSTVDTATRSMPRAARRVSAKRPHAKYVAYPRL